MKKGAAVLDTLVDLTLTRDAVEGRQLMGQEFEIRLHRAHGVLQIMDQSSHPTASFPDGGALNHALLLLAPVEHMGSQESPQPSPPCVDTGGGEENRVRTRGHRAQVLGLAALVVSPQNDGHEMRAGIRLDACAEIDTTRRCDP